MEPRSGGEELKQTGTGQVRQPGTGAIRQAGTGQVKLRRPVTGTLPAPGEAGGDETPPPPARFHPAWLRPFDGTHLAVHALFIAAAVFLLARRESGTIRSDPRLWFVLSVQIVWWIAGVANHVFSKGDVRRFVTLTQVAVNPFLIPISLGLVGGDMKTAAAGSLTFTVLTIILSSRPVSVYTAAAGFVFAVGHRAMLGDLFPAVTAVEAVRLAGAYAAAVGVAVAWRVLLDRFGSLLTQASAAEQVAAQVRECEALKRQVTHLAEERQALHEAVAAHVAHLNEVLHVVGAPEEKA